MYGSTGTLREPAVMCFGGCGDANVSTTMLVRRLLSPSLTCMITAAVTPWGWSSSTISSTPQPAVSRVNDTSASVKRSVGADREWHSRQLGEPKQHSSVGASICLDENVPPLETFYRLQRTDLSIQRLPQNEW